MDTFHDRKRSNAEKKRTVVQGIQHLSSSFVLPTDTDVQTLHVTKDLAPTSTVPDDVDRILTNIEMTTEADKFTEDVAISSEVSQPEPSSVETANDNTLVPEVVRTDGKSAVNTSDKFIGPTQPPKPKKVSYFIQKSVIDPNKKPEPLPSIDDFYSLLKDSSEKIDIDAQPPGSDSFSIGTVKYHDSLPLQFGEQALAHSTTAVHKYLSYINDIKQTEQAPLTDEDRAKAHFNQLKEQYEKTQRDQKLLEEYWQSVQENPTDFTAWTHLLQHCENMGEINYTRNAYNAFLPMFPYCYGYWKRYCDIERKVGNKDRAIAILERGLEGIPLSVDLWLTLISYSKDFKRTDENGNEENLLRSLFERAISAAGLHFRSDNLWEAYIEWETVKRNLVNVVAIYKRLIGVPTRLHNRHWENLLAIVRDNDPRNFLPPEQYQTLRDKACRSLVKYSDDKVISVTKERFLASLIPFREYCQAEVDKRFDFEDKIKRAYYHVKPLEKCQIENWHAYLDFEISQGVHQRIVLLFERCLIACAHYEEFWARYARFMEQHRTKMKTKEPPQVSPSTTQASQAQVGVVSAEIQPSNAADSSVGTTLVKQEGTTPAEVEKEEPAKRVFAGVTKAAPVLYSTASEALIDKKAENPCTIANRITTGSSPVQYLHGETETVRSIYKRACLIHCSAKAKIKLQWALFEEEEGQLELARALVYQVIHQHPALIEARMQHVEMERRAGFLDKAKDLFEQLMVAAQNLDNPTYSWLAVQQSRFLFKTLGEADEALKVLRKALKRDKANLSLYLHVTDICYQRQPVDVKGITAALQLGLLSKELDTAQKYELARRKAQVLREFGSIQAYRESIDKLHELEKQTHLQSIAQKPSTLEERKSENHSPETKKTYVICAKCNQPPDQSVPVFAPAASTPVLAPVTETAIAAMAVACQVPLYDANYTDYYQMSYNNMETWSAAQIAAYHLSSAYPPPEGVPFPVVTEKPKDPNADKYKTVAPIDAISAPISKEMKKDPAFQEWETAQYKEYADLEVKSWEKQPNYNIICSGYDEPELKRRRLMGKGVPKKFSPDLGRFINMNVFVEIRKGKFGEEVEGKRSTLIDLSKEKNSEQQKTAVDATVLSEPVQKTRAIAQQDSQQESKSANAVKGVATTTKLPSNPFADDNFFEDSEFVTDADLPTVPAPATKPTPTITPELNISRFHGPPEYAERHPHPSNGRQARFEGPRSFFGPRSESHNHQFGRFPGPEFNPRVGPQFGPRPSRFEYFQHEFHNERPFHPHFGPRPPWFQEDGSFRPPKPYLRHPMDHQDEYYPPDPRIHHPSHHREKFCPPGPHFRHQRGFEEESFADSESYYDRRRMEEQRFLEPWREEEMWEGPNEHWENPWFRRAHDRPLPVPGMSDPFDDPVEPMTQPSRLKPLPPPLPPTPPPPGEKPCINVPSWFVEDGGELSLGEGQTGEAVLRYFPHFLNDQGQKIVFDGIRKQLKWHQRSSMHGEKWKLQQRLMAWIGPCNYDIGGTIFAKNTQWPPVTLELLHRLIEMTRFGFNSCFLDLYRSGYDYQSWHADNHPALGKNPTVILLNTGSARVIEFRTRKKADYRFLRFPLLPGSLLVMNGPVQSDWLRGIPKDATVKQESIQLSFRVMYAVLPQGAQN